VAVAVPEVGELDGLHRADLDTLAALDARGEEALLSPDAIAESYWQLHAQPRNAWTHELDLRPHIEPW